MQGVLRRIAHLAATICAGLSRLLPPLSGTEVPAEGLAVASPELYTEMFECFESQHELQEFLASVASFTTKAQLGILGDKNGKLHIDDKQRAECVTNLFQSY